MKKISSILILLLINILTFKAQVPDAGVYSIWPGIDTSILSLPHVKGGQVYTKWIDLNPASGVYDWTILDDQLATMNSLGLKATVQVNAQVGEVPLWIFDSVATCSFTSGPLAGQPYPQFWDPKYMNYTKTFLQALATHLKASPYLNNILMIRQNWNGAQTEQYWLSSADAAAFPCAPTGTGYNYLTPSSTALSTAYGDSIIEYHKAFLPEIPVAVRTFVAHGGWMMILRESNLTSGFFQNYINDGFWFFATSAKPIEEGSELFAGFREYCRTGATIGHSENFANLNGLVNPLDTSVSREEGAYWEALWNMHRGISYLCYRGGDLADPLLWDSFQFATKYAGYHASPVVSPGAWIALRPAFIDTNIATSFPSYVSPANYTMHITQVDPDNTSTGLTQIGPLSQKESYWARETNATNRMEFLLDSTFRNTVNGTDLTIRVVYFDQGTDNWSLLYENAGGETTLGTITKTNTQLWQEATFTLNNADFINSTKDLVLFSEADGNDIFHMVEVIRNNVVGIKNKSQNNLDLKIYPNPAGSYFTFVLNNLQKEPIYFKLFDAVGRQLLTKEYTTSSSKLTKTINLSDLSNGIYYLTFNSGQFSKTEKLIISK